MLEQLQEEVVEDLVTVQRGLERAGPTLNVAVPDNNRSVFERFVPDTIDLEELFLDSIDFGWCHQTGETENDKH